MCIIFWIKQNGFTIFWIKEIFLWTPSKNSLLELHIKILYQITQLFIMLSYGVVHPKKVQSMVMKHHKNNLYLVYQKCYGCWIFNTWSQIKYLYHTLLPSILHRIRCHTDQSRGYRHPGLCNVQRIVGYS